MADTMEEQERELERQQSLIRVPTRFKRYKKLEKRLEDKLMGWDAERKREDELKNIAKEREKIYYEQLELKAPSRAQKIMEETYVPKDVPSKALPITKAVISARMKEEDAKKQKRIEESLKRTREAKSQREADKRLEESRKKAEAQAIKDMATAQAKKEQEAKEQEAKAIEQKAKDQEIWKKQIQGRLLYKEVADNLRLAKIEAKKQEWGKRREKQEEKDIAKENLASFGASGIIQVGSVPTPKDIDQIKNKAEAPAILKAQQEWYTSDKYKQKDEIKDVLAKVQHDRKFADPSTYSFHSTRASDPMMEGEVGTPVGGYDPSTKQTPPNIKTEDYKEIERKLTQQINSNLKESSSLLESEKAKFKNASPQLKNAEITANTLNKISQTQKLHQQEFKRPSYSYDSMEDSLLFESSPIIVEKGKTNIPKNTTISPSKAEAIVFETTGTKDGNTVSPLPHQAVVEGDMPFGTKDPFALPITATQDAYNPDYKMNPDFPYNLMPIAKSHQGEVPPYGTRASDPWMEVGGKGRSFASITGDSDEEERLKRENKNYLRELQEKYAKNSTKEKKAMSTGATFSDPWTDVGGGYQGGGSLTKKQQKLRDGYNKERAIRNANPWSLPPAPNWDLLAKLRGSANDQFSKLSLANPKDVGKGINTLKVNYGLSNKDYNEAVARNYLQPWTPTVATEHRKNINTIKANTEVKKSGDGTTTSTITQTSKVSEAYAGNPTLHTTEQSGTYSWADKSPQGVLLSINPDTKIDKDKIDEFQDEINKAHTISLAKDVIDTSQHSPLPPTDWADEGVSPKNTKKKDEYPSLVAWKSGDNTWSRINLEKGVVETVKGKSTPPSHWNIPKNLRNPKPPHPELPSDLIVLKTKKQSPKTTKFNVSSEKKGFVAGVVKGKIRFRLRRRI